MLDLLNDRCGRRAHRVAIRSGVGGNNETPRAGQQLTLNLQSQQANVSAVDFKCWSWLGSECVDVEDARWGRLEGGKMLIEMLIGWW